MKSNKKLNAKDIIITRTKLDNKIKNYWAIIKSENVMSKKAIAAGIGSGYDLKTLHNQILQMIEQRIKLKGMLQSLNMGITTFKYDDFKKTHYYTIFKAGELKEQKTKWGEIIKKCINPTEKSKKGLKGTGKREIFSSAKITSIMNNLQLEINKYDAKIIKFNEETAIEADFDEEEAKTLLAA